MPSHQTFPYLRIESKADVPVRDARIIDLALLDLNHSWPNIGHDALVHAVRKAAAPLLSLLATSELKIRVLSFDVRRRLLIPEGPDRFELYLGTGGPGHLDPRINDGICEVSQGISETPGWEAPLFHLFDSILASESAALLAVCHCFGMLCRWSGVAEPRLRGPEKGGKSSGIPSNVLSDRGIAHPFFSRFSAELPDGRHFRVIDNRLFDLVPAADFPPGMTAIAYEREAKGSDSVTMVEFARERAGLMPRMLGVNHHPEIVDREHLRNVLDEKLERGEVTRAWYDERDSTLAQLLSGDVEQQSRLTSQYTLIEPLRHHLSRIVMERAAALGISAPATVV